MRTDELDFQLPAELIAQHPLERRDASRLLHYRRDTRQIDHRRFLDLPELLRPGDVLVFNDARVVPAKFVLRRATGGRVEGLFLEEPAPGEWIALLKRPGRVRPEIVLAFEGHQTATARVQEKLEGGRYRLAVDGPRALELLEEAGRMPLPPYIRRGGSGGGAPGGSDPRLLPRRGAPGGSDPRLPPRRGARVGEDAEGEGQAEDRLDRERYQTVYASRPGSVAAPTAGLHFTPELLARLDKRGIQRCSVTLHVGLGTFRPVTADELEAHRMHTERYEISEGTAGMLNEARGESRRIVAVGTTSARVLESQPPGEAFRPHAGETGIFIRPPYEWRHVGALLTNFHLPRSTLLALVAALTGLEEQRRIYAEAIRERYRFFSYGDAMLVE